MNDIDFLLEDEKKKMEEEVVASYIQNETSTNETTITDKTEPEKPLTKKKKNELIDDFMKLQEEKGGDIKFTRSKLERLNKAQIIKEIANFMNDAVLQTEAKQEIDSIENKTQELNPHQLELISNGLFQMNQVLISLLETGSQYAKDKTAGIAILEGWSQRSFEKKQQFLDVFKLIYKDYKVELDKYLSPIVQYTILMGNTAAETIVTNIKKKKDQQTMK